MRHLLVGLAFSVSAMACVEPQAVPHEQDTYQRPTFEAWLATLERTSGGKYLVDGDIVTTSQSVLRTYYNRRYPPPEALVIGLNIWNSDNTVSTSTRYNMGFCVANTFYGNKGKVVQAMIEAAAGWESAADIDYVYRPEYDASCTNSNTSVWFNVRPATTSENCASFGGDYSARAFFPDEGRSAREIYICPDATNSSLGVLTPLLRHELGHTLGFVHEFEVEEVAGSGDCTGSSWTDERPVAGDSAFGGADPYSIMTYSSCPLSGDGFLTDYDKEGVASVYGMPTNYEIVPADYDGDNLLDMAVRSGRGGNWFIKGSRNGGSGFWSYIGAGFGGVGSQPAPGNYDGFPLGASGTADISVKFDNGTWCMRYNPTVDSRVYGATAIASSVETTAFPASAAVDGSQTTRWSSQFSDAQWLRIDLQRLRTVNRVRMFWEGAFAAQFKIQVSNTGSTWTDVANNMGVVVQTGNIGLKEVLFLAPVTARYVRILGLTRATGYGYSLWEVEVYATDQDYSLWWPFDECYSGYGNATAKVTAADYDGDGITDLSIKDPNGVWYVDYSSQPAPDGRRFGQWNLVVNGYGDSTVTPVPADYDGDGRADLAIKTSAGLWFIDSSNDWGGCATPPCFNGWNLILSGSQAIYGDASAIPVPADYDGDGKADLAIRWPNGQWSIDYYAGGYGFWDHWAGNTWGSTWKPIPGRWNADNRADLAIKHRWTTDVDSNWYISISPANGRPDSVWDITNTIKQ